MFKNMNVVPKRDYANGTVYCKTFFQLNTLGYKTDAGPVS